MGGVLFVLSLPGSSAGGAEALGYQTPREYAVGPCAGEELCAALPLAGLGWHIHGEHEYYVSVRAANGAGRWSLATSGVYRHSVGLPAPGVVLDVAPPAERTNVAFGVCSVIPGYQSINPSNFLDTMSFF